MLVKAAARLLASNPGTEFVLPRLGTPIATPVAETVPL